MKKLILGLVALAALLVSTSSQSIIVGKNLRLSPFNRTNWSVANGVYFRAIVWNGQPALLTWWDVEKVAEELRKTSFIGNGVMGFSDPNDPTKPATGVTILPEAVAFQFSASQPLPTGDTIWHFWDANRPAPLRALSSSVLYQWPAPQNDLVFHFGAPGAAEGHQEFYQDIVMGFSQSDAPQFVAMILTVSVDS